MAGLEEAVVIHMTVYSYLVSLFIEACILKFSHLFEVTGRIGSYEGIIMLCLWNSKTADAKSKEENMPRISFSISNKKRVLTLTDFFPGFTAHKWR